MTLGKTFSPSSAAFRIWAGLTPSCESKRADDLLLGVQERGQQVHRLEPLVPALRASDWAVCTASWLLRVRA